MYDAGDMAMQRIEKQIGTPFLKHTIKAKFGKAAVSSELSTILTSKVLYLWLD